MTGVLLTGATGFVGGRVARRLRADGHAVLAVVRRHDPDLDDLGVRQAVGGLDDVTPELFDDVEVVVHAAATSGPDLAAVRAVNRDGTRRLVDAAEHAGVRRFVHVSTTSVYDLDAIGDAEVSEDAPLVADGDPAPATSSSPAPYAITKAEAEAEVMAAAARGLSVAVLRPPAVLGAGPTSTWGTRVPGRLRDGSFDPPPAGTTFGWVHVDDLVDAVLAAADTSAEVTANVVGGHTTFGDYLARVAAIVGVPVAPAGDADVDRPVWRGRYADDRLPTTLGVTPVRDLTEAMAEIAASWSDGDPTSSDAAGRR